MMTQQGMMRALVLDEIDAPFRLAEAARPTPRDGEVLVSVRATAINPLDLKIRAGKAAHARHALPAVLGIDMAGVVEAIGPGVAGVDVGDAVFGMVGGVGGTPGALADYVAADARLIARKPERLTMREAAALPLGFITAWEGLVDRARVGPGQKVLIHGGAGGVGHLAIQIAQARGAEVFATGSASSLDVIARLGAVPIDRLATTVADLVAAHTGGEGFDVVFDTVGGAALDDSFAAIRRFGHVVSALGWSSHALAPLSFKAGTYSGVFTLLPLITGIGREHHGAILREAARLVEAGLLIPRVDERRFTLETIEDAFAVVAGGAQLGKVVIDIGVS